MLKSYRSLAFLTGLLVLPVLAAGDVFLQKVGEEKPVFGGTLRIKGYQTPFNPVFDPAAPSHYFIVEQLYDGLVRLGNNFEIMPALAEYWRTSDDGKKITFYLRRGVKFHDGREMTARDVKFSLERLVQNRPGNTCYEYFTSNVVGADDYWHGKSADVGGFKVLDDLTFEIQWLRPYVPGLYLLGMYYCKVLPKALLEEQGRSFFQRPIGTGPFRFAEWIRSPRLDILGVRLERNDAYFGKRPYLGAVDYSPHFTDDQFEEGAVHIMSVTSDAQLPARYQVLENSSLRSAYLSLSCHIPPLDRAEVRRALALGISNVRLAAAVRSASSTPQVTQNFIPALLPGFFPKDETPLYEPDKARILLARLVPGSTVNRLRLTLIFPLPKNELSLQFSRELGRQMEAMGIDLDLKYLRDPEDIQAVRGPYLKFLDWNMVFPDPENVIRPLFFSKSAVNLQNSHYANPALDALVDASEVETSWEKRIGLFRQMEKILFDEVPAIPLYAERLRIALQPGVHGAALPALGFYFLDMKNIWLQD